MTGNGNEIRGPIFISIGDEEKLKVFLEKNDYLNPDDVLVDDYSFGAYQSAGFGRFDEVDKEVAKEATKNMGAPMLGWKGTFDYMTSVGKISPIPADMKFGDIPEGVLRLGGTFVVNGNKILYRWSDRLPGDHPDIAQVYGIAEKAATKKPAFAFPSFLGS